MLGWLKSTNAKVYGEERPRTTGFSVLLLPKNILESVAIIIRQRGALQDGGGKDTYTRAFNFLFPII